MGFHLCGQDSFEVNSITLIYEDISMADIFAAVDFSTVATFVGGAGVTIIGIAMAFKGISLGKRAVNKA